MRSSAQSAVTATAGLTESFELELLGLLKAAPAILSASALDLDGLEVAKVARDRLVDGGDLLDQSSSVAFQRARTGQTYFGRLYFVRDTQPLMTVAVPIEWFEGETAGVLVAEVNLHNINAVVSEITFGEEGYAYVVSDEGELIAHPVISTVLRRENLGDLDQVEDALAGRPIPFEAHTSVLGRDVFAAHAPVGDLGWSVLIEQPTGEVNGPVLASISRILAVLAVALALLAAIGVLINRWYARPVSVLREAAARVSAGEFDYRISVSGEDEFEEIARSQNKMAAQRANLDATLAEQVERRTGELSEVLSGAAAFTRAAGVPRSPAGSALGGETLNKHGEGDVAEAITLLEGAMAKGPTSDSRLWVALNTALCRAYVLGARPQDALRAFERVVAGVEALSDESIMLHAWHAITSARSSPELLATRLDAGERAVALIGRDPYSSELGELAIRHFADIVEAGSLAEARGVAHTAVQLFAKNGDGSLGARGQHMQVLLAMQKSIGDDIELAIDAAHDEGVRQGLV